MRISSVLEILLRRCWDTRRTRAAHWTCSPTGSDLPFWKFPIFSVPLRRSTKHRESTVTWTLGRAERDANGSQHPTALKPMLHGFQHPAAGKPWPFVDSVTSSLCMQEFCVWTWWGHDTSVLTVWPQPTLSVHVVKWSHREGSYHLISSTFSKTTKPLINITNTIQLFLHRDS